MYEFEDRREAGRLLADRLTACRDTRAVVLDHVVELLPINRATDKQDLRLWGTSAGEATLGS